MKVEKKVIGDNSALTTCNIRMLYEDGTEHNIVSFKSKYNNNVTYTLCSKPVGVEIDFCYWEMIRLLQKDYKIKSLPSYFEESNLSICSFKLGDFNYELWCNYDVDVVSLMSKDNKSENKFSDELAVYMVWNLLESISKRNTLGSDR